MEVSNKWLRPHRPLGQLKIQHGTAPNPPPAFAHVRRRSPRDLPPGLGFGVKHLDRIHISPPVEVTVSVENRPPQHVQLVVERNEARAGVLELGGERQPIDNRPGVGGLLIALDPERGGENRKTLALVAQFGRRKEKAHGALCPETVDDLNVERESKRKRKTQQQLDHTQTERGTPEAVAPTQDEA